MSSTYDYAFLGGGLANVLSAYRLKQTRPSAKICLVEKESNLGEGRTWCFHDSDLLDEERAWVSPFVTQSWGAQEFRFPTYRRTVLTRYHCIRNERLHSLAASSLEGGLYLGRTVMGYDDRSCSLDNGQEIRAKLLINGMGWVGCEAIPTAYQKFMGLNVFLESSHRLKNPIVMDATVPQKDGYRFLYCLPWDEHRLLIEDTRYSSSPKLVREELLADIEQYARDQGWNIRRIESEERGVLPLPLEGPPPDREPGIASTGLRAGLFQATTGYSLPDCVRFADFFSRLSETFAPEEMERAVLEYQRRHWKRGAFYRLLNRFMFRGAEPELRYRILEKFYRLPRPLIERFYAGKTTRWDQFRILSGRPPLSLSPAFRALFPSGIRENSNA